MSNSLWTEKYRPRTVADCILPKALQTPFEEYAKNGLSQHLLLTGPAGTGKTTVARAICEEQDLEYLIINCSAETGVDTVRVKIVDFASTISVEDRKKAIILDEADYLSPNAQAALRNYMETFAEHCKFIMTANFKSKLIAPLHSRCANFDFTIPKTEVKDLVLRFFSRLKTILDAEGVEINKEVLARITQKFFPDFRRTLNELQRHTKDGVMGEDILASLSDESFMTLAVALKAKDYKAVKQWVVESNDSSEAIFRKVFDNADLFVQPQSIPELVVLIASYQYRAAFVADPIINILAFFVEAMVSLDFK